MGIKWNTKPGRPLTSHLCLEHLVVELEKGDGGHAHLLEEAVHAAAGAPPPLEGPLLQEEGQVRDGEEPLTLEVDGGQGHQLGPHVGKLGVRGGMSRLHQL